MDDTWGADLVEMQEWSNDNQGYRYLLTVIDVFSKYAWCIPLKDKRGETVVQAFKTIHDGKPVNLWVDQGKEFYNKNMKEWLNKHSINIYSTFGEHKSVVAERFNRTLKEMMYKRFTAENTRNWIDMLDGLVWEYNNRYHSTIGMKPVEARLKSNYVKALENTLKKTNYQKREKPAFKINDKVRISRIKGIFEKGYLPNWSEEMYTIHSIKETNPVTYILKDGLGEVLQGGFYREELQPTSQEIFRVEKVLKRKKIKGVEYGLVKWVGYSEKHNQWIPIKDTTKI